MRKPRRFRQPGPTPSIIFGGPAYRLQLDARHAVRLAGAVLTFASRGYQVGAFLYLHGCPVEQARNRIMERALAQDDDILICIDSDVWVENPGALADCVAHMLDGGYACAGLPVRCADGVSNVWQQVNPTYERTLNPKDVPARPHHGAAIGTAVTLYNLPMYRKHWPTGPWFRTDYPDGNMMSEDVWHTSRVFERFGKHLLVWGAEWGVHAPERGL